MFGFGRISEMNQGEFGRKKRYDEYIISIVRIGDFNDKKQNIALVEMLMAPYDNFENPNNYNFGRKILIPSLEDQVQYRS